jgi:hypothetical protein
LGAKEGGCGERKKKKKKKKGIGVGLPKIHLKRTEIQSINMLSLPSAHVTSVVVDSVVGWCVCTSYFVVVVIDDVSIMSIKIFNISYQRADPLCRSSQPSHPSNHGYPPKE